MRSGKPGWATLCCSEGRSAAACGTLRALRVAVCGSACLVETKLAPPLCEHEVLHGPAGSLCTAVSRSPHLAVLTASSHSAGNPSVRIMSGSQPFTQLADLHLVGFQHLAANRDVPHHETSAVGGTETTSTSLCHQVSFQASAISTE